MSIKILYVDDEDLNLRLFEINFNRSYDVLLGTNGFEGLELLEKYPDVHIVISDMKMPGMNGIEFIKEAKRRFPDKKFYILTGFEITSEINEALETGLILKYFRKPFNIKEIKSTIDKVIS